MTSIYEDEEASREDVSNVAQLPQRFSHIRIGTTTPSVLDDPEDFEEEEVIDIGAVPRRNLRAEETAAREIADEAAQQGDFEEEVDFGLDDLPPMPAAQKVVLFFVILMVVIAVFYVVRYWFGV